jgi:hypothetical protein
MQTQNNELEGWELKLAGAAARKGKRGRPKKETHGPQTDIRAAIPVDRRSIVQRLSYGLSLMALGEDERYE